MSKNQCVVCGRFITWRFSLCRKCEKEYGKRVKEWPEWVRYLVNQSRRERRDKKLRRKWEIQMSDIEDYEEPMRYSLLEELDDDGLLILRGTYNPDDEVEEERTYNPAPQYGDYCECGHPKQKKNDKCIVCRGEYISD